jgi:hypothetical protein
MAFAYFRRMRRMPSNPVFDSSNLEKNSSFNVVILYEDFESGTHAKRTYDLLATNLGQDCRFWNHMWKFDVLCIPKLGELAARDAASADIVIVSCHGANPMGESVKQWFGSWGQQPIRGIGLIVLFTHPEENLTTTQEIRHFFDELARQGNMEFFAQPKESSGSNGRTEHFVFERRSNFAEKALFTLQQAAEEPVPPRWGINE